MIVNEWMNVCIAFGGPNVIEIKPSVVIDR
jgi:hypothetical protein